VTIQRCLYPACRDLDGQPRLTAAGICSVCQCHVERDLTRAPRIYVDLHLTLPPGNAVGRTEKVSGTRSPRAPLNMQVLATGSALCQVLTLWVSLVRVDLGMVIPPSGHVRESVAVARFSEWLLPRLAESCAISPQSAMALRSVSSVARKLLGLTKLVHRLASPCPDCGLLALFREDGAAYVRCGMCGASWAEELYQSLARVITMEGYA
jgi:hypothetical protein